MDIPTIYCEQFGQIGIQYLNIFTNIFFIIFSILFIIKIKKINGIIRKRDYFLAILLGLVGIGSFAWHVVPNNLTDHADTLPIILLVLVSLGLILKKIFKGTLIAQAGILFIIILAGLFLEQLPALNGSLVYVFFLLLLIVISIFLLNKNKEASKNFQIASIIFFFGIIARTSDLILCTYVPFGTHFMWHILVATMGYFLLLGISSLYSKN